MSKNRATNQKALEEAVFEMISEWISSRPTGPHEKPALIAIMIFYYNLKCYHEIENHLSRIAGAVEQTGKLQEKVSKDTGETND